MERASPGSLLIRCFWYTSKKKLHLIYVTALFFIISFLNIYEKSEENRSIITKSFLGYSFDNSPTTQAEWDYNGTRVLNQSRVISTFKIRYVIEPDVTGWGESQPYLACLVHSLVDHFEYRVRIRQTWGAEKDGNVTCDRIFFVLGKPNSSVSYLAVQREASLHKDILLGDFEDKYRNLLMKARTGMRFATEHVNHARYILKVDDDILVNMKSLRGFLKNMENVTSFLSCRVWAHAPPFRNSKSKLYVPKWLYPDPVYPPFCSGSAYIMARGIVSILDEHVNYVKSLPVDDVVVTGLAREDAGGIRLVDTEPHYLIFRSEKKLGSGQNFNETIHFVHHINSDMYHKIWYSFNT